MEIAYTPEQEALRQELRGYFRQLMTPEVEAECAAGETGGPHCLAAVRQMGQDGWLGIGWPVEYGGQGKSEIEQLIFFDEAWRAGAPIPFLTINTVGRTIMAFGSEEQKQFFLPRILQGGLHFSIGYTEPGAGTDLASLRTTATLDGDEWVINGQKVFTSLASYADYIWLAARTDPDAPKHKGITIFLVPTASPGFSLTKIDTMVNASTFSTYYENLRVPRSAVVGDVNRGWDLIVNQLNYERVSLAPAGMVERLYEETRRWAQDTKLADGRRAIDQEWVQLNLARVHAKVEVLKLLNWRVAAGSIDPAAASGTKVFGTEMFCEVYRLLFEVVGQAGYLRRGSAGAVLAGRLERSFQGTLILTFGGGTNEVERDLVALFGLGLPRVPAALGATVDFTFSEEQQAIAELAGRILSEQLPPGQVRAVEQEDDWFARDVWAQLARAELLGVCLGEDVGGSGYGILEACLLAEQQGRAVAPLPVVPTLVYGAMPVDRFGSPAQRRALLPGVVSGDVVLTAALHEAGNYTVPDAPVTAATGVAGGGWRLDGEKQLVPAAHLAHRILVPARTGEATSGVFVVDPRQSGVALDRSVSTTGEPQWQLTLDGVAVDADAVLGAPDGGQEIVAWIVDHATAALCATAAGVCEHALELTAQYVSEHEQFGAKIGSFQAVSQRAADAWIDVEAIRLTAWQAAWRLSAGVPAASEPRVAKFWAAEAGQRVVHTAQHLHGGVGVDLDYPIHRYFRWAKQLELTLGGATVSLLRLGAILAAEPV